MQAVPPLRQPVSERDLRSEPIENQLEKTLGGAPRQATVENLLEELVKIPKTDGAAVGLARSDVLVCVAAGGSCGPKIGTRCSRNEGLTGLCFTSGRVQLCNDAEKDDAADAVACRQIGVKSVLAIPLRRDCRPVGVLELLSSEPNAFNWKTIRALIRLRRTFEAVALEPIMETYGEHSLGELRDLAATSIAHQNDLQHLIEAVWFTQQRTSLFSTALAFTAVAEHTQPRIAVWEDISGKPSSEKVIAPPAPQFLMQEPHFGSNSRAIFWSSIAVLALILCLLVAHESSEYSSVTALSTPQAIQRSGHPSQGAQTQVPTTSVPTHLHTSPNERSPLREGSDASADQTQAGDQIGGAEFEARTVEWLKKAANLGDYRAQNMLSNLYFKGIGVRRDLVRAYTWAAIAAHETGVGNEHLVALRQQMTQRQLQAAERRIDYWFSLRNIALTKA